MNITLSKIKTYCHPHALTILMLGFASGLPFALTASTLLTWMTEIGVNIKTIGLFTLVATSYSLKFLWAPILDQIPIPILSNLLGRRVSWIVVIQIFLMIAIIELGFSDPNANLAQVAFLAVMVAFLSASQDIVIDAYRIELLSEEMQPIGVTMTTLGYRIAILCTTAGALFLSEHYDWSVVYCISAFGIILGMITVLITGEPKKNHGWSSLIIRKHQSINFAYILETMVVKPFKDFMTRPRWLLILLFVIFFKLGDAMAAVLTQPFLLQIGFSKAEIATIVKTFGFFATIAGLFCGAWLVYKIGMIKSLFVAGVLQMLSNLLLVLQARIGYDTTILAITIGVENFTSGIGDSVRIAYLSSLCNIAYTATQYALLSSLATVARNFISSSSGFLQAHFGWADFFLFSTFCAIPGLVFLVLLSRRNLYNTQDEVG